MVIARLPPLLLLLFVSFSGMGQPALPDVFYRGTEYTKVITTAYGTPFLYDDVSGLRKVRVAGTWYEGMELHYDAEDDQLVTLNPRGDIRLQLVREKVNAFMLGNRTFQRIADQGFFELLHEGVHDVLVKWQKVLVRKGVEDPYYRLYSKVYVNSSAGLEEVAGKGDLMKYFGVNKKKGQDHLRSKGLNVRKDLPGAAAELMRFADEHGYHE